MPGPLPPLRLGTLICHKPFTEFVLAFMYDPEQVSLDTLGADELNRRIRAFVGEDVDAVAGRAGAGLLDSYYPERQPVGAQGVQRAITSLQEGAAVKAALGYEPAQPAEAGWKALGTLYEPGPAGDERRNALVGTGR
jgi:hypothetical protein